MVMVGATDYEPVTDRFVAHHRGALLQQTRTLRVLVSAQQNRKVKGLIESGLVNRR